MKRSIELFPPLADIERRLFGVSEGLLRAVENGETSEKIRRAVLSSVGLKDRQSKDLDTAVSETVAAPTELPPHIADLVRRRVAVSQAKFAAFPMAGQIVEVTAIRTPRSGQLDWVMQVPLHVLLDAPAESAKLWHGWLVSAETDYATSWDFVLQEQDAPFDPEAGMIQVWNPVRLYMPMAGRVVAQLRAERLQAVRALAADFLSAEEPDAPPRPGRVAVRGTSEGLSVATGSPLGGDEDPRQQYQRIYHYAAEAVREPAKLAIAELQGAPNRAAALLQRLVSAARSVGDLLVPVPRVEVAMGRKAGDDDAMRRRHDIPVFMRLSFDTPAFSRSERAPSRSSHSEPALEYSKGGARRGPSEFREMVSNAITELAKMIEQLRMEREHQLLLLQDTLHNSLKRLESLESMLDLSRLDESVDGLVGSEIEHLVSVLRAKLTRSAKKMTRMTKGIMEVSGEIKETTSELHYAVEESYAAVINRLARAADAEAEAEAEDVAVENQDLSWHDIARIRIVSVTPEGAGELLIIPGNKKVIAFLEDDETKINKVEVKPGDHPAHLAWEAGAKVKLILNSDDGRKLELPLFLSP